jgi:hypothetical protein
LALAAGPALVVFAAPLASYGTGALPGTTGSLGPVPQTVATDAPACGTCHGGTGNENNLVVALAPSARVLSAGQAISITTSATGGRDHAQNWGGFVTRVTRGALTAGATSQVNAAGDHATHVNAFTGNRSWTYGYTAPVQPGPVEVYSVVNTADGDGRNIGDIWGFHGPTVGAQRNTPVWLYVNATGVAVLGSSCAGGFGLVPVLGSPSVPRAGQPWTAEVRGCAPNAALALFVGANPNFAPIDLSVIGVHGCTLWIEPRVTLAGASGPGDPARGEGSGAFTLPVPADPRLTGQRFEVQAAIVDANVARALKLTLTNGLAVTIQP